MKAKILLQEKETVYNELIANEKKNYNNGTILLSMLNKLGVTVDRVNDWQTIEQEFTKDYPKATLTFNLQANGIEDQYRDAEAFYLKNQHYLRFEPLTDNEIEDIKESQRVYASTEKQIEAHTLINSVVESLNRLHELGVNVSINKTYLINRVFEGDLRANPPIKVDTLALYHTLVNLK